jgi:hypothetical protein
MLFAEQSDLAQFSVLSAEVREKPEDKLAEFVIAGAQHAAPLQRESRLSYFL